MSFIVSEANECVPQYKKIWNEVELQLFEKLYNGCNKRQIRPSQVENVERMHKDKLSWPRCPIRHALQCNGGVKNYHPQVYVEECKYSDVEN